MEQTVDQSILAIQQDADAISGIILGIKVTDEESNTVASGTLGEIKDRLKKVENMRIFFTKPLNQQVKNINAMFAGATSTLENLENHLKIELAAFYKKKQAEAQAEADRRAREQAARDKELREKEEAAQRKLEEAKAAEDEGALAAAEADLKSARDEHKVEELIAAPVATTKTEAGTTSAKKVWKWEVTDVNALILAHPEFFVINPTAIKDYVQERREECSENGLRIFQDIVIAHRS